jgi:hypothetical protein
MGWKKLFKEALEAKSKLFLNSSNTVTGVMQKEAEVELMSSSQAGASIVTIIACRQL